MKKIKRLRELVSYYRFHARGQKSGLFLSKKESIVFLIVGIICLVWSVTGFFYIDTLNTVRHLEKQTDTYALQYFPIYIQIVPIIMEIMMIVYSLISIHANKRMKDAGNRKADIKAVNALISAKENLLISKNLSLDLKRNGKRNKNVIVIRDEVQDNSQNALIEHNIKQCNHNMLVVDKGELYKSCKDTLERADYRVIKIDITQAHQFNMDTLAFSEEINKEKCAIFLNVTDSSEDDKISDYISKLLHQILTERRYSHIGTSHIQIYMNEIELKIKELERFVALCPSCGIGIMLCFKSIKQIKNIYPIYYIEVINCCDTLIHMGSDVYTEIENAAERLNIDMQELIRFKKEKCYIKIRGFEAYIDNKLCVETNKEG